MCINLVSDRKIYCLRHFSDEVRQIHLVEMRHTFKYLRGYDLTAAVDYEYFVQNSVRRIVVVLIL